MLELKDLVIPIISDEKNNSSISDEIVCNNISEKTLENEENKEIKSVKNAKTKDYTFSLVYKSGPDFAIRKENINYSFLLSVLITKKQVVIIDEKKNIKETILSETKNEGHEKTYSKIKNFFRGCKKEINTEKDETFFLGNNSPDISKNLYNILSTCELTESHNEKENFIFSDEYRTQLILKGFKQKLMKIGLKKNIFLTKTSHT